MDVVDESLRNFILRKLKKEAKALADRQPESLIVFSAYDGREGQRFRLMQSERDFFKAIADDFSKTPRGGKVDPSVAFMIVKDLQRCGLVAFDPGIDSINWTIYNTERSELRYVTA